MLVVQRAAHGRATLDFLTTGQGQGRRSHRDTFQFTHEETDMRRLVITYALPCHAITILMVMPQGGNAIAGLYICRVNMEAAVICQAQHQLFTPVAQDIALCRGITLRPVVGDARKVAHHGAAPFQDGAGAVGTVLGVEHLVEQVAIPVDAVIQVRDAIDGQVLA